MNSKDRDTAPQGAARLNRRNFLKKGSLLVGLSGAVEIRPEQPARRPQAGTPGAEEQLSVAIIGFGQWGREIASTLGRMPEARLVAVCDSYDVMLKRAKRSVPEATTHGDYREVLDNPDVQAVFIATPTHLHREIAVAALEAGKHVYCEAPMAASIEDARAIAKAAQAASKQIFQVGQLYRSNPQHRSVFQFIRSGAIGTPTMGRAQWHAKESWRRASPNPERQRAQNWRLDEEVSVGLIGEVGMHQIDTASWFLNARPVAVTGFGQVRLWDDGRRVPDTIQAIIAFSNGVHMIYDATLASSFDAEYDLFYGSDSTILMRDSKAWMFKEVDAPMVGWEVYARKDTFYKERGIALVANATKLDAQGQDPAADDPNVETPLWYAIKEFVDNYNFGPYPPSAGYPQGYESTVIAVKANEAVMGNKQVVFEDTWFELS